MKVKKKEEKTPSPQQKQPTVRAKERRWQGREWSIRWSFQNRWSICKIGKKFKEHVVFFLRPFLEFDQLIDFPQDENQRQHADDDERDRDVIALVRPHVHLGQRNLYRQHRILAFDRCEPFGKVFENDDDKDEVENEVNDVSTLQIAQLHLEKACHHRVFQQVSELCNIRKVFQPFCVHFLFLVSVPVFPFLPMLLNINRPCLSFCSNLRSTKSEKRHFRWTLTSARPSVGSISGLAKMSNLIVMKKSSSSASPPDACAVLALKWSVMLYLSFLKKATKHLSQPIHYLWIW